MELKYAYMPWGPMVNAHPLIRFVTGTTLALAICFAYVWFFLYSGIVWDRESSSMMFLMLHLCIIDWMFLFSLGFDRWPFSMWFPQPIQGLLVGLCSIILGYYTYSFAIYIGWVGQIFSIGLWVMFFLFLFGAWSGFPGFIREAYESKQPITGISTGVTAVGLGILFWWFTVAATVKSVVPSAAAVPIGMPFAWFGTAIVFGFCMANWPFQVKQPQQLVISVGYLVTFSLLYMFWLHEVGMDWYSGPYGGNFTTLWNIPALYWIGLAQMWPVQNTKPWIRGLIIIGGSIIASWFFWFKVILPAGADFPSMVFVLNWFLGIFVGWIMVMFCCGWAFLSPPPVKE